MFWFSKPSYPKILSKVNSAVNAGLYYLGDIENYGKSDVWVKNPFNNTGDCEDYALTKQDRLHRFGICPKDLDIQLVYRKGQPHAVLVYKDTWVLDNFTDVIWNKNDLKDYTNWIKDEGNRKIYDGSPKENN
jgi:predicted transglutaminase-like cysteine proteinase